MSADDWHPGDLALCVSKQPHWADVPHPTAFQPQLLCTYTVAKVGFGVVSGEVLIGLREDACCDEYGFLAACFRKIRPHTPDAEDAETIRLLRGQPVKEPVA